MNPNILHAGQLIVVILVGLYFVILGVAAICSPSSAQRFLLGFADSAPKHYAELLIRFVAGGAFVLHAPLMRYSGIVSTFGWVLLVTTVGLTLIPWRWHDQFARQTVPAALRYLKLIGVVSLSTGAAIFYSLFSRVG